MLAIDIHLRRSNFALEITCALPATTTGLFGPSGSGKTTLLHALAGLVRADSGRIAWGDEVLFDAARRIDVPAHRRGIGVVFQDNRLFPQYNVAENLRYGQRRRERRVPLDQIVDLLELEPLMTASVNRLSGGERRRVALARALAASPRLLLLDEPLAGLDEARKRQMLALLARVRQSLSLSMILVSHELSDILFLTHELMVIDDGAVAAAGSLAKVIEQPRALALIHRAGLPNLWPCRVREHREDEGMTLLAPELTTPGPSPSRGARVLLKAPYLPDHAPGGQIDITLRGEDIAIALAAVEGISIQNQIRGRIARMLRTPHKTVCMVDVGVPLLVDITHQSVAELSLAPGKTVWCLFKAHAITPIATTPASTQEDWDAPQYKRMTTKNTQCDAMAQR